MKVRITESIRVNAIVFNGKVGFNRKAPLSECVLMAAREKPGITRRELSEHFAIPLPWVARLCAPLLAAKLITETPRGIRVTAKARATEDMLPVGEKEGNFLALLLDEKIDTHQVLCCVSADDIFVDSDDIGEFPQELFGESFAAAGQLTLAVNREGKTPRTETAAAGTLLDVVEDACVQLMPLQAAIVTEDGKSEVRLRGEAGLTRLVSVSCDLKLPVSPRFKEPEKLAEDLIRARNASRGSTSREIPPGHLLKAFVEMSNEERQSGRGRTVGEVDTDITCEAWDVPIYPRNRMAFQEWAAWRCRNLITRHMTRDQYARSIESTSQSVPGCQEHGPLDLPVLQSSLSPKQRSYLNSADCWPDLPQ